MSSDAITPSGLMVPADVADDLQRKLAGTDQALETRDPDGRRRVVLTRDETKLVDRLLLMFQAMGIGMVYCCSQHPPTRFITDDDELKALGATEPILKPGWKPRCLKFIVPEGWDENDPDKGYGCECTRIHIQHQGIARRIRR